MSTYSDTARQGKATIGIGVTLIGAGAVLQAINVQSIANSASPGFVTGFDSGRVTLIATVASLLFLSGVIVTIIGTIRYAQSGHERPGLLSPTAAPPAAIVAENRGGESTVEVPVSTPGAFCSSCGARIVGAGHFCASCGTPVTR